MDYRDRLIEAFCEIDDFDAMKQFFKEILTPAEIQDVALRWRLMEMLHEGIPQRQIASELKISLCKITRGSKILKDSRSESLKILNRKTGENNASREKTGKFT